MNRSSDPHRRGTVLHGGADLGAARAAMIMMHGRGAGAGDMMGLAHALERPQIAFLAPEAAGHSWYPFPFIAPAADNEPGRSSALNVIADLIGMLIVEDILPEHTIILGFSQGACLALEFAARNPMRYGGVVALSGGLIGDAIEAPDYSGSLDGTPVFLGCSDVDPHIPLDRVQDSTEVMRALGGVVTERIYRGMGHTVNEDEIAAIRTIIDDLAG